MSVMDGLDLRNSSTKRAGFEAEIGYIDTNTELDIDGTEDVTRDIDVLDDVERARLKAHITALSECTVTAFCSDKASLVAKAGLAWDRAWALFPTYREELDNELDDLKQEFMDYICLWEQQWARMAGSSLNSIVIRLRMKAQVELARRLAGMIAERRLQAKEHETQAIAAAFGNEWQSRQESNQLGFAQIGALYQILKGSKTVDITDRDYTENRDEDKRQFTLMGKFYNEGIDISDQSGTYIGDVSGAWSASEAIAGIIPRP